MTFAFGWACRFFDLLSAPSHRSLAVARLPMVSEGTHEVECNQES